MTNFLKVALLAATALLPQAAFAQAAAPAPAAASAPGYAALADLLGAVRQSTAFTNAARQIETTYKAQIDAYNARSKPLNEELQRLQQEIQTLQNTAGTAQATLQQKVTAYQAREKAIEAELTPLGAPFERPLAYAQEQVAAKLDQAVRNAMAAKRVTILIRPEALAFALPTANITSDVVAQLNALVPSVGITPPAGWQPGQQQQQQRPAAGR
jgi:Skp family chaperone for outer membrane proteins